MGITKTEKKSDEGTTGKKFLGRKVKPEKRFTSFLTSSQRVSLNLIK